MAEFSIIETYFNRQQQTDVDLGVGDDSALLSPPLNHQLVICTDTLVAGRPLPLEPSPHVLSIFQILLQWVQNPTVFYSH